MNPVRCVPGLALILTLMLAHGAGTEAFAQSAGLPGDPERGRRLLVDAARSLADSVQLRLATAHLPVRRLEDGRIGLDIGTRNGVRGWSTLTLSRNGRAWTGTVADLEDDHVTLAVSPGPAGLPAAGEMVRVRLEARSLAVAAFKPGPIGGRGAVHVFLESLRQALRERAGLELILIPDFDAGEQRLTAMEAGADFLATISGRVHDDRLGVVIRLRPLREGAEPASMEVLLPAPSTAPSDLASLGDTPEAAPPGCRFSTIASARPGLLLDFFRSRYQPGHLLAVFSDRIETLKFESDEVVTTASRDLDAIWPRTIPSRWPVAGVLPVNSVYGLDRREERVVYTVCSNERSKFLALGLDRKFPDSLDLSVSREPREARTTSFDACFPRVDRVQRPDTYRLPPEMPEGAVTRLVLGDLVTGPAGVAATDESGRPRTRRVAVLYYHEATASLWLSAADTAYQVPGHFGSLMADYRAGRSGPPGLLVTEARPPGEGDRLLYYAWHGGRRLDQVWEGAALQGSITALSAGDLDADGRDDIVVAESSGEASGGTTRLIVYSSRPDAADRLP